MHQEEEKMERVEHCGSVSHWLLRYLQQGGAAFLTYAAHLRLADGVVQRALGFFLAWHIKLCMPAYISDPALSHPFLFYSPAPDYVTQMGCSQEGSAFHQGCLHMQSAVGRLVFPGTGSGSPWKPCARHSCIHLIPEHGIVLPALELEEIKQ